MPKRKEKKHTSIRFMLIKVIHLGDTLVFHALAATMATVDVSVCVCVYGINQINGSLFQYSEYLTLFS